MEPLYIFSIFVQRTDSSIAEIIPLLLLNLCGCLKRLDLEGDEEASNALFARKIILRT